MVRRFGFGLLCLNSLTQRIPPPLFLIKWDMTMTLLAISMKSVQLMAKTCNLAILSYMHIDMIDPYIELYIKKEISYESKTVHLLLPSLNRPSISVTCCPLILISKRTWNRNTNTLRESTDKKRAKTWTCLLWGGGGGERTNSINGQGHTDIRICLKYSFVIVVILSETRHSLYILWYCCQFDGRKKRCSVFKNGHKNTAKSV